MKILEFHGIARNGLEAIEKLTNNKIDIILLDLVMPLCNGYEVLEKIKDLRKYDESCIVISGNIQDIYKLKNNCIVHKILYKVSGLDRIVEEINKLVKYKEKTKYSNKLKKHIKNELLFLGYDFSHKGTKYLIETIEYIALNPTKELERLESDVYPFLAKKYQKSVHNIKCSINRATTFMYCQCEINKLKKYFFFSDDRKPKVKTIIYTIINKL